MLRDPEGQYWWLAEALGHEIDGDVQKIIDRTSSQDSGVAADADVVVATASLEVGFDDDRVGAVLQHKAPRDAAQFLQRKGPAATPGGRVRAVLTPKRDPLATPATPATSAASAAPAPVLRPSTTLSGEKK
jgi:hypothetical protein